MGSGGDVKWPPTDEKGSHGSETDHGSPALLPVEVGGGRHPHLADGHRRRPAWHCLHRDRPHPRRPQEVGLGNPQGSGSSAGDAVDGVTGGRGQATLPVLGRAGVGLGVDVAVDDGQEDGGQQHCEEGGG